MMTSLFHGHRMIPMPLVGEQLSVMAVVAVLTAMLDVAGALPLAHDAAVPLRPHATVAATEANLSDITRATAVQRGQAVIAAVPEDARGEFLAQQLLFALNGRDGWGRGWCAASMADRDGDGDTERHNEASSRLAGHTANECPLEEEKANEKDNDEQPEDLPATIQLPTMYGAFPSQLLQWLQESYVINATELQDSLPALLHDDVESVGESATGRSAYPHLFCTSQGACYTLNNIGAVCCPF